ALRTASWNRPGRAAASRPEARGASARAGDDRVLIEPAPQALRVASANSDDEKALLLGPVAGVGTAAALEEQKASASKRGLQRVHPDPVLRGAQPAPARVARRPEKQTPP